MYYRVISTFKDNNKWYTQDSIVDIDIDKVPALVAAGVISAVWCDNRGSLITKPIPVVEIATEKKTVESAVINSVLKTVSAINTVRRGRPPKNAD